MDPELSAPARIVWSVALGMAVGAVASLAAIGFVDLVQGIIGHECRGFGSRRPCPPCRHPRAHGDGRQTYDSRAPGSTSGQGTPASLPAVR